MSKSVHQAVEEAFDDDTRQAFGDKYLELVYANWADAVRTLRRRVLLLVLAALAFLILNHAHAAEIEIGPLRVDNISAILILLPAAVSFLLFEGLDLLIADHYYKEAASASMKMMYPSIYKNNLELLLEPTTGFALGVGSTSDLKPNLSGPIATLRDLFELAMMLGLLSGAIGFIVYAYWSLFGNEHAATFAVVLSLLVSVFNLARGTLSLVAAWPDT